VNQIHCSTKSIAAPDSNLHNVPASNQNGTPLPEVPTIETTIERERARERKSARERDRKWWPEEEVAWWLHWPEGVVQRREAAERERELQRLARGGRRGFAIFEP